MKKTPLVSKVTAACLVLAGLLGSSANAQLLHRYDFNTTNDTVGTANGTLNGTATLSGGALVTAGGNGAVSGLWGGTGPMMILDPSVVSGITNSFAIETWFSCSTGWPKYDSLFAFSDGTTANFLMGNPVMGYSPWPSGCNILGGGGSASSTLTVRGIYLDSTTLHQFILTYDGTTFTLYEDGAIANFNGYSPTATETGFNLSTMTDVAVNGGSPWGDPSLTGSTYDFRVYGQALTAAQVTSVFGLGSDASNSAISNAIAPPTAFTWDGAGADNNWSTALNWTSGIAPAASGSSITFAGSTRTSPNMNANYSVTGLTFTNAGSYTLGTTSSTLTLDGNVVNDSANSQTINVPLSVALPASLNAASNSLVVNSNITLAGPLTLTGNNNFTLNGNISGSGNLIMAGAGALTLGGASFSAGGISFNNGISSVPASVTSSGSGITYVGYLTGNSVVNVSGSTCNFGGEIQVGGSDTSGSSIIGSGLLNLSGSTVNAGALTVGRGNYLDNTESGTVILNNSTFVSTNDVIIDFAGKGAGKVVLNNSTFTIGPGATKWFTVGMYDSGSGELDLTNGILNLENGTSIKMSRNGNLGGNVINQVGGAVTFYSDAGVTPGGGQLDLDLAGSSGSASTYNLSGGTLTVPQIIASSTTGSSTFNFNGGTLKPTASTMAFMQGLTAANVMAGGAIIDTTNYNISIGQNLANGDGLNGGLTKLGSGTLALAGGFGFSGPVFVDNGTLSLDLSQSTSVVGLMTISNAALTLLLNNGSSSLYESGLVLKGNTVLNLNYGTATTPSSAAISAGGATVSNTGATVINVAGQYLTVGEYPLIYTGGSVPTNHFALGSLPTGVVAVLTNSGASLDMLITAAGQTLTWYGANSSGTALTTWDIDASSNWNDGNAKYLQYSGNSYGDNVTFDDTLYSPADAAITLNATVVPASVTFNNTTPYSFTGSGGIGGATSVAINGGGMVTFGTANSYTGGTVVSSGTLDIAADSALGAPAGAVTLAAGGLQVNGGVTNSRPVVVTTTNAVLGVATNVTLKLNGSLTGAGGFSKVDNGTLTLAGASTITGPVWIDGGMLNLTGSLTPSFVSVGNWSSNAVLDIAGNLTADNLFIGNASGTMAAVYQTAGTLTLTNGVGDFLNVGNLDGSYGYYNAAGGVINVNGISIGGEDNTASGPPWPPAGANANGLMEVNGATINNIGWITLARGVSGNIGVLNMFSGSLTYSGGGLGCNWELSGQDQTSIVNVMGGSITSTNEGINFRTADTGVVNLNAGVLQGTAVSGPGVINFNGGTLKAGAASTGFMSVSRASVFANGGTIDDGGFAVTLGQPLVAADGYGVSAVALSSGGSGYIAPPIVTLSGGTGSNATAIATMSGGVVTGITVTSPGTGYASGDSLTVSFTGGGASATAPTVSSVALAANTSGGLTKIGNGTLTLTATNTYAGPTVINAGNFAGTGTISGAFTNNATLSPGTGGSGALTVNGNLTLSATSTNVFTVNGTTPANTSVVAGGNVTYGGVLEINAAGTFTAGQNFQLFSGTGAASTSSFAKISTSSGILFGFTNGVLTVVSTIASNPTNITASVSGSTLTITWPADHLGWILQAQTNHLGVGLTTNGWVAVPNSSSGTSSSLPIVPANPAVFYRLSHP